MGFLKWKLWISLEKFVFRAFLRRVTTCLAQALYQFLQAVPRVGGRLPPQGR